MLPKYYLASFYLIVFFLTSLDTLASEYDANRARKLADSAYWHRLLHYYTDLFGVLKSYNDEAMFFLAPEGKKDPYKELVANIEAFNNTEAKYGRFSQAAQCVFPARYRYLKEELQLKIKDIHCGDYLEWKDGLNVGKVSLGFSTAYANNPSSLFGHTLIRLHNKNNKRSHELLDYSVGFAANAEPTGIGIEYAIFGLVGGYRGHYLIEPYFKKITDYNNGESRDLWEYEIKLEQEQIDRMVAHLWELYSASGIDYFFVDENCALHLLGLIEVANIDWDLRSKFKVFTVPLDTIKLLKKYNALKEPSFRASNLKKLNARLKSLSAKDKNIYEKIIDQEIEPKTVNSTAALDAAIENLNYYKYKKNSNFEKSYKTKLFRKVLVQRSKYGKKEK